MREQGCGTGGGTAAERFAPGERRLLIREPGINAVVIARLEEAGYSSIAQVIDAGIPTVIDAVCALVGSRAWINRRRPLERAVRGLHRQQDRW